MNKRPRIKIEPTEGDILFERMSWFLLIILWVIAIFCFINLPATMPIHFNSAGQPDNYGSRTTIFLLPAVGTILFGGITLLNKFPFLFNYPVKITSDNALRQYTIAIRMMRYLKFILLIIFSYIEVMMYLTATGNSTGLSFWFLPVMLALIFIPLIYFVVKLIKAR